ncbi:MAG: GumC family protein [Desulfatibacillaceae bacterium]
MAQYDVDLRDYWRILKERKFIIVITVLLLGVFSYGFSKFREPVPMYQATASVKIEKVSSLGSMLLDSFTWSSGDTIATQAAIITSYPVLSEAARRLGWIPEDPNTEKGDLEPEYMPVIERLKGMISTEQESQTSIVNIKVVSRDPREAPRVANTVARAHRDINVLERNRQTLETREFLEKQLQIVSQNLEMAEERRRRFKENNNLVSIDAQTAAVLSRMNQVETQYMSIRNKRRELEKQLEILERGKARVETLTEVFYAEDTNSILREMAGRLSDLSFQRKTLLLEYTREHPQVEILDGQMDSLVNEIQQEIKSYLSLLESREKELQEKLEELRKQNAYLPEQALLLARLERDVDVNERLYLELKTKHQETQIKESGRIAEISIVRPAMVSSVPINVPSKLMATLTGIVTGLILGIVFAFVSETLDTSIGTIEDVEGFLQVPVLGVIPNLETASSIDRDRLEPGSRAGPPSTSRLVAHFEPKSIVAEAYRALRTNLYFMGVEKKGKSFMVTSATLQEGKTFSVVNLALSMAQTGDKTLLVEADLRKPSIYRMFGLDKEPGLTDYILGNYRWQEAVNTITDVMLGDMELEDILRTPGLDNLSVMTAGTTPPNPSEILRSPRFAEFIREAEKTFDVVLIDAPPVLPVADAAIIGAKVHGVIIVYEVGKVARGILKRAKVTLDNVDASVLGIILNNVKPEVSPDFYTYHYRYYAASEPAGTKEQVKS